MKLGIYEPAFGPMGAAKISRAGRHTAIYALVLVFGSIGTMKFTAYEAGAIEGLIASSPLLDWLYVIHEQRGAANLIGVIEVAAAALLAVRPWSPVAGAIGAVLVMATTAVTLTFLFTAPGWEPSLGGFPALSVVPGRFLIKDAVLFAAALWVLGDALRQIASFR